MLAIITCGVSTIFAVSEDNYGKAGFFFGLVLVNAIVLAINASVVDEL